MEQSVITTDRRLIEAGFPCHQVGAETQRERGASSSLPPLYFLHVWWARRPLTPSRAAILGSLLPADTDPEWFLRQLGIEKVQALVNGEAWTLDEETAERVVWNGTEGLLEVNGTVLRRIVREQEFREQQRVLIKEALSHNPHLVERQAFRRWMESCKPIPGPLPREGECLRVYRTAADPAWFKELLECLAETGIRIPNLYGYKRAYTKQPDALPGELVVLDPTAGGGSIPFEALRLGCEVIANDLNPVAAVILRATLEYPTLFGNDLSAEIQKWGTHLLNKAEDALGDLFPSSEPVATRPTTETHGRTASMEDRASLPGEQVMTYIYCRQVTCPHCGGEAPLLNTCWLSKEGDKWAVRIVTDGKARGGKVWFETYRVRGSKGPNGEDPNFATVSDGVGTCVHCRQAIPPDEIRAQARGESSLGRWQDRLYCVVAVRYQPKLDKNGRPVRYASGERAGQIRTEKVVFYRPPNDIDLAALREAERRLAERWPEWEAQGLIPTEALPTGHKTSEPLRFGMKRWCDMFTPRQLLGHLTLVEELNRLKPEILRELGEDRGRAVVTYLQFAIDKGLDYNSKQTRWEYTRGIVKGTFGRHDYSLKWTFGEMVFTGPNSGSRWALSQVVDAYSGIAGLLNSIHSRGISDSTTQVTIRCGTAAYLDLPDASVDLVCMDPPYYNNVQYAELSDYFYVWQRRTLRDLYPELYGRLFTNKTDEAVANPARDGSAKQATIEYERMMSEIFTECRRVLKDNGVMSLMFTHKKQEAWEALTRSLMETGWIITSTIPVESESEQSTHQKDMAAAASSIFICCRKRIVDQTTPATWSGFGGRGVVNQIRDAVREALKEFEPLKLNPVDEMVASYGRALQVLSQNWPVLDGDELVSPIRAMNEASAVVAQYQIARMTDGRIRVEDLSPEAAMAFTLYGIFGLQQFPYDEALSLSRSLNVRLEARPAGYRVEGRMIGINAQATGRRTRVTEETGYYAPLVKRGSKLRLALPEERNPRRLQDPQTEWDVLHGLIMAYREGDVPVARAYLDQHARGKQQLILDLLSVWAARATDEKVRKEADAMLFGMRSV
ncbi:MAG: DUF1156 domain-containing protein [Alicyclobacillus macrosporangiidus]|uniref:DUF1156 domain-containing protein n=1 Tax=Alicyclobacillus macrosporangiidus TaxID=392015 RepID=UPI0026EAD5DA|nr:DUF1156 domain-containing protein [Alicyclobacillus macrosporangiidus]MCL6597623.1 DUF1156 domain-containing protein [Alicyclobacillus macrosporangiidus]